MSDKCNCKAKLARRLAQTFDAPNWVEGRGPVDSNTLGAILGIEDEDAEMLVGADVIRGNESGRVELDEVIRFLEQNGRWWYLERLRRQLEALRRRRDHRPVDLAALRFAAAGL